MRTFRMFFGIALAAIVILFVARIAVWAFLIAAVMSITYAVFRRIKDFIIYDRFEREYIPAYEQQYVRGHFQNESRPFFNETISRQERPIRNIHFIDAI